LWEQLWYLHTWGEQWDSEPAWPKSYDELVSQNKFCHLFDDFAPASFYFEIVNAAEARIMNGGLIYHGDQSGWRLGDGKVIGEDSPQQDPLSVCLTTPTNPWSIHT